MVKRFLTGFIALLLFVPVLYFSETIAFPIIIGLLSAFSVYEFAACIGFFSKKMNYLLPVVLMAFLAPITARIEPNWLILLGFLVFIYLLFLTVFGYDKIHIDSISTLLYGFIYTAVGFAFLVMVRDMAPERYLLIFIAAWCTDTFAYMGGRLFGKRKLCPNLSPKKTVAGAVSGIVGTVCGFVVFGIITVSLGGSFNFVKYCIFAVLGSVVAQIGDLSASAIKRHYGVKDYGSLFPGHGGVIDRFDSVLPLSLGAYLALSLVI